jgi:hypothetical protein
MKYYEECIIFDIPSYRGYSIITTKHVCNDMCKKFYKQIDDSTFSCAGEDKLKIELLLKEMENDL